MDPNKDNEKKNNNLNEEEANQLMEDIKKHQSIKKRFAIFNFLLHPNYLIHLALSFCVNTVITAVVIGFSSLFDDSILTVDIIGFILAMLLLTLIENLVKILLYKYYTKLMFSSFGLISFLVLVLNLALIHVLLQTGFHFNGVAYMVLFAIFISIFRTIFSQYIRRIFIKQLIAFRR